MTASPPALTRDRPIIKGRAALLVIDVQNGTCGPKEAEARPEFYKAAALRVIPNIAALLKSFRNAGLEVIYTVIEDLTADGRDRSLDYKLSDLGFPKGSHEAQVVSELAPLPDEIVLPKTSSSVFNSTNLDYLLRNMGIEDVFVVGYLHRSMHRPCGEGWRRPRLLHDLRARRLRRGDRGASRGGAAMLQRILPHALHRRRARPRSRQLIAVTSPRQRPSSRTA